MTRLVIPVGRPAAVVTVSHLLNQFLESQQYAWVRDIFGLRRDIPYVAGVLADSILPVNLQGFWQVRSLLEAKQFFIDSMGGPSTAWEAKQEADQLLLLLGTGQPAKARWGALPDQEVAELKKIGAMLYAMAAEEITLKTEQDDLVSMSLDFCPWTEVLAEFRQTRPLITV